MWRSHAEELSTTRRLIAGFLGGPRTWDSRSRFLRCNPAGFDIGSDRSDWGDGFDEATVHFINIKSRSPRVIEGEAADAPVQPLVNLERTAQKDNDLGSGSLGVPVGTLHVRRPMDLH